LIIACRQDKEKGTGVVIESLPLILRDFPQASLDVVGDGQALGKFNETAAALGVTDRITFHGKVDHDEVIRLLQQADLFCYPTTASEGFPKVVLEALACGLPVVTTPVSVLSQLIGTGCGLIIEEATPTAVARAVRECLSQPERYRMMSATARHTAQQYSLERWRDTIGNQLQETCGAVRYAI
jgi:2-deoxystreptamine N-acetyl-D-glucosaminyltransferase/2-deoxystreptamine glucosyltransferase